MVDQLRLREQSFPLVARGYDPARVHQVLEAAAAELERLRRPPAADEFSAVALEAASALRRLVATEIEQVRQAARRGVDDVQAERERLLTEAREESRRIVEEARRRAEQMLQQAEEARMAVERERSEVQARLDAAVRTQTELLAALEAVRVGVHRSAPEAPPAAE